MKQIRAFPLPARGTYWRVAIKFIEMAELGAFSPNGGGLFELFARERRYWSDYIQDQNITMEETLG